MKTSPSKTHSTTFFLAIIAAAAFCASGCKESRQVSVSVRDGNPQSISALVNPTAPTTPAGAVPPSGTSGTNPGTLGVGTFDSGGGSAVVCRDREGNIDTVRLLDLVEAEEAFNLTLVDVPEADSEQELFNYFAVKWAERFKRYFDIKLRDLGDLSDIADQAAFTNFLIARVNSNETTDKEFGSERMAHSRSIVEFMNWLGVRTRFLQVQSFVEGEETEITRVDDSHELIRLENCEVLQLAHYLSGETIATQQVLWNRLPLRDRVALIFHEYLYKANRRLGHTNSLATRRIVGQLFSNQPWSSLFSSLRSESHKYICTPQQINIGSTGQISDEESILEIRPAECSDCENPQGDVFLHLGQIAGDILISESVINLNYSESLSPRGTPVSSECRGGSRTEPVNQLFREIDQPHFDTNVSVSSRTNCSTLLTGGEIHSIEYTIERSDGRGTLVLTCNFGLPVELPDDI